MGNGSEFEKASPLIVDAVKGGATIAEAAQQAEITERTVKRWLTEGRRNSASPYANFSFAIDFIRESRSVDPADAERLDRDGMLHLLEQAARKGNVQAMKVWLDNHRAGGDEDEQSADPLAGVDELAARRVGRA